MRHAHENRTESSAALELAALQSAARQWAAHDPDTATAARLRALVADPDRAAELSDSFDGNLQFGTAGLRAAMGPGPNRMNKVVVRRAAAGVAAHLLALADSPGTDDAGPSSAGTPASQQRETYRPRAVVGFDARHNSADFARDTAAIFAAAGIETFLLPAPLPTPVLAYAVRALSCEAGIMVTASHNPAQDNGYKVYLGGRAVAPEARGVQIVAPHDSLIAAQIDTVANTAEFGDTSGIAMAEDGWSVLGDDLVGDYRQAVASLADSTAFPARGLRIVHTSMHGVGHETALAVFHSAGFTDIHGVPEQATPDPEFPTVPFPNPEELGAMDMAFALAQEVGADIVLANDPDADRAAVGIFDPSAGQWHQLHGDQVGALLGAHLVARGGRAGSMAGATTSAGIGGDAPHATPVFANSIVSSRLLAKIAAAAGYGHVRTLTGFKWISRVPGLSYGYEEALGYCVAPELVRDKDGISAALLMAEMAAGLKAAGLTLLDVLDDLALAHGLHASTQISIRVEDPAGIKDMMARLREQPPAALNGSKVTELTDLSEGSDELPATDGLAYLTEDGTRVIVRPSGTEPKLKCYLEVIVPVAGPDHLQPARDEAQGTLAAVVQDVKKALGLDDH
ncbi:phosphoglucomutase [Arthrobacter sp. PAMC 25486]|uniref:phospho-sugar mutase n=1 Tax=Arthrobacter sp. PAMC 25486 TaxID=1494608 RepID=UPI000535D7A1|nr:phospho-sugar mutase [Arthrobacter sp. PAMC 25486]AIY03662.1 phosphoglucomutase [Arthrobacter sp. PAMC 25486]